MRKLLLAALFISGFSAQAQSQSYTSDFETLPLMQSVADTYYVNYSQPRADVGFYSGPAYFPCAYDTAYGGYWAYGFAYSNVRDTVTTSYSNEYASRAGRGAENSNAYVVAYGEETTILLDTNAAKRPIEGFYITNSTVTANILKNGNSFSKKFGGTTGNDPDYFKMVVYGYKRHVQRPDSVEFYLADYRFANNASDYIVKDWRWVPLSALGAVDSLSVMLRSTDNGQFGINTPVYYCMDNMRFRNPAGVAEVAAAAIRIFPNPAQDALHLEGLMNGTNSITVSDASGKILMQQTASSAAEKIDIAGLVPGIYFLRIVNGNGAAATLRFQKQ